ncbi:MAG TPA: DUF732 domain-containing protein [Mycobacterium sp.]|nr:DUF732 domain-containing protein [Mycobacterium sp.]
MAGVVAAAGQARADPDPGDAPGADAFLASLQAAGITYNRPDLVINTAETVCRMVGEGKPAPDVLRALQERNPGLTPERGGQFLAIAMRSYCPNQLASSNPSG